MVARNPSEFDFNALVGFNSAFIYNVVNIKFNINPYRMAIRNFSKFSFSCPVGSNSAFIGNVTSFNFNLGGCDNPSIN